MGYAHRVPITPTLTDYDILDRPVRITIPDGSATLMTYGFGPDRSGVQQFRTLFVDAEGNRRETFGKRDLGDNSGVFGPFDHIEDAGEGSDWSSPLKVVHQLGYIVP